MEKEVKKVEVNEVDENENSDVTGLFVLTIVLFIVVVGLTIYSCFI